MWDWLKHKARRAPSATASPLAKQHPAPPSSPPPATRKPVDPKLLPPLAAFCFDTSNAAATNARLAFENLTPPTDDPEIVTSHIQLNDDALKSATSLVRSNFLGAIRGDREARQIYEDARLFHYDALPEWGKSLVFRLVSGIHRQSQVKSIESVSSGSTRKQFLAQLDASSVFDCSKENLCGRSGLRNSLSFSEARELHRYSTQQKRSSKYARLKIEGDTAAVVPEGAFALGARSAFGKDAQEAMRQALPLMMRIFVVEDLCSELEVQLSSEQKQKLVERATGTWELCGSREVRNLLLFADLRLAHPQLPDGQAATFIQKNLRSSSFTDAFMAQFGAETETHLVEREKAIERSNETVRTATTKDILELIEGAAILHEWKGQEALSTDQAKRLSRLVRKGFLTVPEIKDKLQLGIQPDLLMQNAYQTWAARPIAESSPLTGDHQQDTTAAPPTDITARKPAGVKLDRYGRDGKIPFNRWISSLRDERAVEAIDRRLLQLAQTGELGDCKWINGLKTPIVELRIHLRPAYRVYLRRFASDHYEVVLAGTKARQDQDIEDLKRLFG